MTTYQKIRQECEKKKISIRQLEEYIGLGCGTVGKWKNGTLPRADKMCMISQILEVPVEHFFEKETSTDIERRVMYAKNDSRRHGNI